MADIIEHSHTLDTEGEICTECGLFEEFFEVIPDCPAIDDDADEEEEDSTDDSETETETKP